MRCECTLLQVNENRWIKPDTGYLDPDPDCSKCMGKGFLDVEIVMGGEGAKIWIGICSLCGETNGIHFEYPDMDLGPPTDEHGPQCLNKECKNKFCSWVKEEDIS